jgi:monoamine oxidase
MSTTEHTDTLIIGAGAAGLAAAAELGANGRHVMLVEARERTGGRIFTDTKTLAPLPIELGAEFIHGESQAVLGRLETAKDIAIDASRERWTTHGTRLVRAEARLRALKRTFSRMSPPERDMPFAELLHRRRRSMSPAVRELAWMMVEGFDAADPARISAREVLDEWSGPAAADGPTFRPAAGYDNLLQSVRRALPVDRCTLQLGTVVRTIAWGKRGVEVEALRHGERLRISAPRAIVTVPLGVLQLPATAPNSMRFTPELDAKRTALAHLAAGPVIKVVMSFARPFWAELDDCRYRKAGFFFAPGAPFPTFWTSLPLRTSLLVAWCAGPRAERLGGRSDREILACVHDSLRALFGRRRFSSMLQYVRWHDWQRDPFACGAYSYLLARGGRARQALARPLADTLFFAGEACDTDGEAATVGGALTSGTRAARQVMEAVAGRKASRTSAASRVGG